MYQNMAQSSHTNRLHAVFTHSIWSSDGCIWITMQPYKYVMHAWYYNGVWLSYTYYCTTHYSHTLFPRFRTKLGFCLLLIIQQLLSHTSIIRIACGNLIVKISTWNDMTNNCKSTLKMYKQSFFNVFKMVWLYIIIIK